MSEETTTWLNQNVLIGFADQRGKAWHWRADAQGDESNHYPGAIPREDVLRRLFNFTVLKRPVAYRNEKGHSITIPDQFAWVRDDTKTVLGISGPRYVGHPYDEFLLGIAEGLLGGDNGDVEIGSAGLLKGGARAWVSLDVPETRMVPGTDVQYRPHLLATTTFDGTLATTFKLVQTLVVCDNTREYALGEKSPTVRVRHTRNGRMQLVGAASTLGLIDTSAEAFEREVNDLLNTAVTDAQWDKFVAEVFPAADDNKWAVTVAGKKRDAIRMLWASDERVAPWKNTAWGAVQAVNTWQTHMRAVKGHRAEAVMTDVISGRAAARDAVAVTALRAVGVLAG